MAIKFYLAMTAEEISENTVLPENSACIYHTFPDFSQEIPKGVIPVLTDCYPVRADSVQEVAQWISDCEAVLLDFEKPEQKEAGLFARLLQQYAACPVVVSELYAGSLDCPVFLSPLPHNKRLKDYLAPWYGREIWMDLCPLPQQLRLTEGGCSAHTDFLFPQCHHIHKDKLLHCRYSIDLSPDCAAFTFWRTDDDFAALLGEMEASGVRRAIGLYGEWTKKNRPGFPERF